jgi:hypothetical protein
MLVGMPQEPAGITVTLAFAISRNFQFAFLTPEEYQQLPLLRFFFSIPTTNSCGLSSVWSLIPVTYSAWSLILIKPINPASSEVSVGFL